MKKLMLLPIVILTMLPFVSCDKVEKLLFKPFESPLNFEIEIPAINSTEVETSFGATTVSYNLEDEIRKNTSDKFGADIVGAMYINNVAITLLDSDQDNDLSNFDYINLNVSSGSATPAVFGPFNIPAGSMTSATFPVSNGVNIRPYFNDATFNFSMTGKANKVTTRTLKARISATIKFEK
jgi:hypothetical protein